MQAPDRYWHLPPHAPAALLQALNALRLRALAGEPVEVPAITVHVRGLAAPIKGELVAFQAPDALLLRPAGDAPLDALYLAVGDVVAVAVHYHEHTLHLLSDGRLAPHVGPAPTKGDLDRRAHAASEGLTLRRGSPLSLSFDWDALPNSDAARYCLSAVLEALTTLLVDAPKLVRTVLVGCGRRFSVDFREHRMDLELARRGDELVFVTRDALAAAVTQTKRSAAENGD